jgi:hypothetical protein
VPTCEELVDECEGPAQRSQSGVGAATTIGRNARGIAGDRCADRHRPLASLGDDAFDHLVPVGRSRVGSLAVGVSQFLFVRSPGLASAGKRDRVVTTSDMVQPGERRFQPICERQGFIGVADPH